MSVDIDAFMKSLPIEALPAADSFVTELRKYGLNHAQRAMLFEYSNDSAVGANMEPARERKPKSEPAEAIDIRHKPATEENLNPDAFALQVEYYVGMLSRANPNLDPQLWFSIGEDYSESRESAIWEFTTWYPPRAYETVGDYERRIAMRVFECLPLFQALHNVDGDEAEEEEPAPSPNKSAAAAKIAAAMRRRAAKATNGTAEKAEG